MCDLKDLFIARGPPELHIVSSRGTGSVTENSSVNSVRMAGGGINVRVECAWGQTPSTCDFVIVSLPARTPLSMPRSALSG